MTTQISLIAKHKAKILESFD